MRKDRQYSPSILGIRPDHVARYRLAERTIPEGATVLDAACGCGYGSWMMHKSLHKVTGVDISRDAIHYASEHYPGPRYWCQSIYDTHGKFDALVSFETIEHLERPALLFYQVDAPLVICSVPNEERYPFKRETFADDEYPHLRHYTPKEFEEFLAGCGVTVKEWYCQKDKSGPITPGTDGMFLIAVGAR